MQLTEAQRHLFNQWVTPAKVLTGFVLSSATAVLITHFSINFFTWWQNQQITNVECQTGDTSDLARDFRFFDNAVQTRSLATDKYCLAQILEEDKGIDKAFQDIRNLYKQAVDQGLKLAEKNLCRVALFPDRKGNEDKFSAEFGSICCPPPIPYIYQIPVYCPWKPIYILHEGEYIPRT